MCIRDRYTTPPQPGELQYTLEQLGGRDSSRAALLGGLIGGLLGGEWLCQLRDGRERRSLAVHSVIRRVRQTCPRSHSHDTVTMTQSRHAIPHTHPRPCCAHMQGPYWLLL